MIKANKLETLRSNSNSQFAPRLQNLKSYVKVTFEAFKRIVAHQQNALTTHDVLVRHRILHVLHLHLQHVHHGRENL